jgi:hypothetical protein
MTRPQPSKIRDSDLVGLKYFNRLMPLLERLHPVGTQRDRAGNRQLFFDHYGAYLLLFLFNPIVTSLRGIQQASQLKKVQKKLGCPRLPRLTVRGRWRLRPRTGQAHRQRTGGATGTVGEGSPVS